MTPLEEITPTQAIDALLVIVRGLTELLDDTHEMLTTLRATRDQVYDELGDIRYHERARSLELVKRVEIKCSERGI